MCWVRSGRWSFMHHMNQAAGGLDPGAAGEAPLGRVVKMGPGAGSPADPAIML